MKTTWKIDPAHSSAQFVVRHMMITNVRGGFNGMQGTVVLQATISKAGTSQNLKVVSGPPMLQQAAIDAVKTWRYRPYLLNNEPVEVETTVSVIFRIER